MASVEETQSPSRSTAESVREWLRSTARRGLAADRRRPSAPACSYRVTGLAAEAAFFAVLSVPPLIFAMAGAIGFVTDQFSPGQVDDVRNAILDLSQRGAHRRRRRTRSSSRPSTTCSGAAGSTSSRSASSSRCGPGSRALNVFVDTITIMHGLGGHRGIVQTRALSFVLYVLAMVTGVVSIPLVVAGPTPGRGLAAASASTSSCTSTGRSSW